ncbi:MAG: 5-carboxymethyl-2-hydroxymuconate Delta-isomerase [Pseudomonadota bacterium]
MPHLTVEYSSNLPQFNAESALMALNQTLVASGQFEDIDIKSRAVRFEQFLVGTSTANRAFVHAKLALLSGRTTETKQALSKNLLDALQAICVWPVGLNVQLCVEVQDIERESYAKTSIG